jgi:hypothetical protein
MVDSRSRKSATKSGKFGGTLVIEVAWEVPKARISEVPVVSVEVVLWTV